ncbi:hypothetical protein KUCAC02_019755 [Chaenocephalus aceratus]|uniref:Uncharacterized protein n=1 Tax=Chaenocephalus aceratus TaxID=36190 RepID=A0ACB9VPB6_CHAAC|nr:hypothetical protein KUCAC02_019755 [Chaenocephalus aceratus]
MFPGLESALPGLQGAPWLSKAAEEAGQRYRAYGHTKPFDIKALRLGGPASRTGTNTIVREHALTPLVEQSRQAPSFLRGEAPNPPRPMGPGPAQTNTERKQRSLDFYECRGTSLAVLTEQKITHLTGKPAKKLFIITL